MANSDLITGARRPIYVGDVKESRPNSENVNNKISGNINFILERLVIQQKTAINGYINPNSYDDGVGGIIRIENQAIISNYDLALRLSGNSGTSSFNYAVYNSSGAFVNNLFSTAPSISGNNGVNVVIGKDGVDTLTPTNFSTNTAGHVVNHGTLSLGITVAPLEAGYILVPFIVSGANKALNLAFNFKLKEL